MLIYSFKQFDNKEYPAERVIEEAARMGFDGVEILMRRLESHDFSFLHKIKKQVFDAGLIIPLYSIHQSFVNQIRERGKEILITPLYVSNKRFNWESLACI